VHESGKLVTAACATCGAPLPADANYCPKCGRLVATSATAAPKSTFPRWLLVVIIAGAAAFLALPIMAILAAILIPNFLHARALSEMAADQGNLKQIAVALEEYAVDHSGRYPDRLPQLVPKYVAHLPNVPGGDGTGAYDYHHPGQQSSAYEIWDDGSMDPGTFGRIPMGGANGPACLSVNCKYVVYRADVGIIGEPGAVSTDTGRGSSSTNQ